MLTDVIVQRIKALSPEEKTRVSQEDPVLRAVAIAIAIEQVISTSQKEVLMNSIEGIFSLSAFS